MTKQTITIEAASTPKGYEYTGEYRRAEPGEPYIFFGELVTSGLGTRSQVLILRKIVPLWVPPKGVYKQGWITRDEGGTEFWWHVEDAEYNCDEGVWATEGDSMLLFGTHPDSLPPLTIPAHLSKFRVGDE